MKIKNHSTLLNVERPAKHDNDIVLAAQAGSHEAFSELYALYSRRLYKTIIGITKNPADTEDVLQETFLKGYLALHAFEGRASFSTWLTQIAINTALMGLRKRRRSAQGMIDRRPDELAETICFEIKDPRPNPEQIYDSGQRRVRLHQAIRKLSPRLREAIEMWITNESSMKEISCALNVSVASVKTRLYRARTRLSAHTF
jgi:RNA polymerase sigma-70 factor, ECF subfamily